MDQLRVGVLIGEEGLRKWQLDCIEEIVKITTVEIVAIIQKENSSSLNKNQIGTKRSSFFKRLGRSIFLPKIMQLVAIPQWIKNKRCRSIKVLNNGIKESFPAKDLRWIQKQNPDLLLRFGFGILSGEILNLTPHGIWSFHHGDLEKYRGRPSVFWELYNGEERIGITLQKLSHRLDAGKIIERGFIPVVRGSFKGTLKTCYSQSAHLIRKGILNCLGSNIKYREPSHLGKLYSNPGFLQILCFLGILLQEWLSWFFEKAFLSYNWKIGTVEKNEFNTLGEVELNPEWLPGPSNGFYADPVFSPVKNNEILFECWSQKERKGSIKRLNLSDVQKIDDVLSKEFHLSFPQIYKVDGKYWLVPEMQESNEQLAFEMNRECTDITQESKRIEGLYGVDPVLFNFNHKWWAFISPGYKESSYHLNLFYSDSFFGPYHPHDLNPVVIDPHGARMAGRIYVDGKKIFRFGQVFGKRYGEGVDIFELSELTQAYYEEKRIGRCRLASTSQNNGLHSIDFSEDRILVDGYTLKPSWRAGMDRLLMRIGV